MTRTISLALVLFLPAQLAFAQTGTVELDPLQVFAERRVNLSETRSESLLFTDPAASHLAHDLSDMLEDYPGFASYRRDPSYAAHPTTQGIRLRNLGANATSRTLVLRDGVPQNDPFGGWVYWHRYAMEGLRNVSLYSPGNSEAWGNYGSGGSITLLSHSLSRSQGSYLVTLGSDQLAAFELSHSEELGQEFFADLDLRYYHTDGYHSIHPADRGSIDRPANSEASAAKLGLRWQANDAWRFSASGEIFGEQRNNGTPLAGNESDAVDLSWTATRLFPSGGQLNLVAYHQDRDFQNLFTSVRNSRTTELPVLDQYDVPAEASGLSLSAYSPFGDDSFLLWGADARWHEGQVNERFRNLGDGFTRERKAGGEQELIGAFATLSSRLGGADRIAVTARLDRVEQSEGFRQESDLADGSILRRDDFPERSENELSYTLSWTRHLSESLASDLSLFSGFRSPTLNELYRPFRVGNDITEANPALPLETLRGIELSLSQQPSQGPSWRAELFHYWLRDTIANVPLSDEPGFHPLCGFVPPGGSCSQRGALERSVVRGLDLSAQHDLTPEFSIELGYILAETEITRSDTNPALEGQRFAHAPDHRLNARIHYTPTEDLRIWLGSMSWDTEYEDLFNTRRLPGDTLVELGLAYRLTPTGRLTLRIENLLDETVITGLASNGTRSIGPPLAAALSWRQSY